MPQKTIEVDSQEAEKVGKMLLEIIMLLRKGKREQSIELSVAAYTHFQLWFLKNQVVFDPPLEHKR